MRYTSEVDVKEALGIESWRNLSKDTFLRFLELMPEIDKEVALQLIGQIPELTSFAKLALDDAGRAYDSLLASNTRSMEIVHEARMEWARGLTAELDRDLSPEERMRVYECMREIELSASQKDTENKKFLAEQYDKRLAATVALATTVAFIVAFSTRKSRGKQWVS